VTLNDVNNNAPTFQNTPYETSISEVGVKISRTYAPVVKLGKVYKTDLGQPAR